MYNMEAAVDMSSSLNSNASTQTDFVNSPILWQCLYVVQQMPEFRNLTYRITKTWNDVEMIMVYREGVVGVFGPPVDSITLTLDPKGKCLLSIPFKPVQRVSIVSSENGHIEIASLLAVLRMVAGKGYLFCPGLPERFLAGKACGKFVVLHKVPFKRYQSTACPVYYQTNQTNPPKSSLCALCPRCMQAAKWIQSLPYFSANGTAAKAVQQPAQQAGSIQQQLNPRPAIQSVTTKSSVITQEAHAHSPGNVFSSPPAWGFMSQGITNRSSSFKTAPNVSEILNMYQSSSGGLQKTGSMDVNGNSQIAEVSKSNTCMSGQSGSAPAHGQVHSVNEKLLERKSFLRSLLQERSKSKLSAAPSLKTETAGGETSVDKRSEQANNKNKKGRQKHKNVCHYCKKTFSTPANLMNHFQRHEAVSGSWQKQFKERRLKRNHARSSSLMRMLCWRLKSLLLQHGKKPAYISETSLRLLLKYLDDMIPFLNGATSLKQIDYNGIKQEAAPLEEKTDFYNIENTENGTIDKKYSLKRNSSGQSVMQTLIEAAALAGGADQEHVSSPTVSSSSSLIAGTNLDGAVPTISQAPQTQTVQMELAEASVPEKKRRKGQKLKKVSNKHRKTKDKDANNETVITNSTGNSLNHSFLTNLNLLSDVSMQTAVLETSAKTENSINLSQQLPTSAYPQFSGLAVSHSSLSPSSCLNNVPEINASFIKEHKTDSPPLTVVNGSKAAAIPHLPQLLPAWTEPGTNVSFIFPSQKQNYLQLGSPTSLLRQSRTVNEKQPVLSSSLEAASGSNASPNNSNCGAIDLSKPKLSQAKYIPFFVDKKMESPALPSLPQMVTYENPEIVSFLKRTTKAADVTFQGYNETQSATVAAAGSKSAKSDLQFPSTSNTRGSKGRKGVKNTGNLHTVVDTSSRASLPGDTSLVQSDEIHCSYKWTGSGGMVKEHTQKVRELVPSHIMASFLSKPWFPSAVTQRSIASLHSSPKAPGASTQTMMMSKSEQLMPVKPHNFPITLAALNLSKGIPVDAAHVNDRVSGGSKHQAFVISTSISPAVYHTSASPSLANAKSSCVNISGLTNFHPAHHPETTDVQDHHPITSSPHKMQFKQMNFSHSSSLLSAQNSSSTSAAMPSPSLSVLSQRVDKLDYNPRSIMGNFSHCGRLPDFIVNQMTTPDNSEISCHRNNYIKPEPDFSQNVDQEMIAMPLLVKEENVDLDVKDGNISSEVNDSSPSNLVLDMSPDSTTSKDEMKTLTLGGHFISEKADLISQKGSVICDS